MNILLLSAYDAVSHRLWRERLQNAFSQSHWQTLILAPRHFNWRIRSNALHWAYAEKEILEQNHDLLIATSMVDLATLRGLVPTLGKIPSVLYFHENQFAYPAGRQSPQNIEPMLVPLYSALCADEVLFNSQYNLRTFLEGANSLSKALPEPLPTSALEKLQQSQVIPVALPDTAPPRQLDNDPKELQVLWNHRWEYDKGPELLRRIIELLTQSPHRIKMHIVGQQFREQPPQFEKIVALLETRDTHKGAQGVVAGKIGYIENQEDYANLLASCDVVLSTALHDFQGLAMQEACQAGCTALAPNALAYPEYLPDECLYPLHEELQDTAEIVVDRLQILAGKKLRGEALPAVDLTDYLSAGVARRYRTLFTQMGLNPD